MYSRGVVLVFLLLAPVAARGDAPFATDWAASLKSRARLIADGEGRAGFEVELSPGAITYWRDPGDAGVPPTFDFAGSSNVARADVLFPAPERIAEPDGGEAFGYRQKVVFPIRVAPVVPGKPVTLALNANYAVCEKICLPARAKLELHLPAGPATPAAAEVASAFARVPRSLDAKTQGLDLTAVGPRAWRLCWAAEPGHPSDMFIEPPPGWWMTANRETAAAGRDCFALSAREAPADATFPVDARVTIVRPGAAVETTLALSPKP
jgi:DsbC/DsbD-like thiol-disulfide interchange protein